MKTEQIELELPSEDGPKVVTEKEIVRAYEEGRSFGRVEAVLLLRGYPHILSELLFKGMD